MHFLTPFKTTIDTSIKTVTIFSKFKIPFVDFGYPYEHDQIFTLEPIDPQKEINVKINSDLLNNEEKS